MSYIVVDQDLRKSIMFQYRPELVECSTTKGNLFRRYEDAYGGLGVKLPYWFLDFLKENDLVDEISENVFSIRKER